MAEIKDSGKRQEYTTGAVRDISEGKGRCDLLPLNIVGFLMPTRVAVILNNIEKFKTLKNVLYLSHAIDLFAIMTKTDNYTLMLEVSKHYEDGAKKYSENNWKKGIPLHSFLDSAVRHLLQYLRGDTDEPHDRAFVWNILGAIWTYTHKPELDDVEQELKTDITNKFIAKDGDIFSYDELQLLVDEFYEEVNMSKNRISIILYSGKNEKEVESIHKAVLNRMSKNQILKIPSSNGLSILVDCIEIYSEENKETLEMNYILKVEGEVQ